MTEAMKTRDRSLAQLKAARDETPEAENIVDTYSTPEDHAGVNSALRRTREEGQLQVDQHFSERRGER